MAIRINLLAEAQETEELRRKDPVKRGVWIGGFCVAMVLLWVLKLQLDIGFSKSHYNSLDREWKKNSLAYATVTNNIVKTAQMDRNLAALDRLATNRFYWAPVLNALQQTMIEDIQVIKVTGHQTYAKEEMKKVAGKGGGSAIVEKIALFIEAKDFNPNAENYNKFKESLCNFDFFVKSLKRRDGFILDGTLSVPMVDPSDASRQFVTFKLASHFPEVRRHE